MLEHFQVLLESIIADPEQPISRLQVLAEAERQQLLVEWNDTGKDYPRDKCVHELFEARVAQASKATALLFDQEQLTYSDLNRRANQLAHRLQALGVVSGSLVDLCVERSVEMVVGMMAILKAGSAYVPLDPDYPAEHLMLLLEDTAARLVRHARRLVGGREPARPTTAEQLPGGSADKLTMRLEARQRANDAVTNAVKNYVPRPYGGCVTLFRSRRQRTVSSHDPEMGWGQLARGGLKVVVIPGDHGDLLDEPFVGVLATKLQACLDEARADD